MYEYRAQVIRVVDGDTIWFDVDYGFDQRGHYSFRLAGINAPEMSTDEGKVAKEYVAGLLPPGTLCVLTTIKDKREKFGRYLAYVTTPTGIRLNDEMIELGLAVPYDGGAR